MPAGCLTRRLQLAGARLKEEIVCARATESPAAETRTVRQRLGQNRWHLR